MELEYNNEQIRDIAHLLNENVNSYLNNKAADTELSRIIYNIIEDSNKYNPWFISEHVISALKTLAFDLEAIATNIVTEIKSGKKTITVILRTNAPFEGIPEIIYLALYFDKLIVQTQPELQWFFRKCLELFQHIPFIKDKIAESTGWMDKIDGIVAMAPLSDTAVEYFKKYPSLQLYSQGYSIVLSGEEEKDELDDLAERCCIYFGRGEMNVRIVHVPANFELTRFCLFFDKYSHHLYHHKYFNNFDYRKSSMILNKIPFTECGPMLLTEDKNQVGYTGVLIINRYDEITDIINEGNQALLANNGFQLLPINELKNLSTFRNKLGALKTFIKQLD